MDLDTSAGNPSDTLPSWDSGCVTAVHSMMTGHTKGTQRGQQSVAVEVTSNCCVNSGMAAVE